MYSKMFPHTKRAEKRMEKANSGPPLVNNDHKYSLKESGCSVSVIIVIIIETLIY